MFCELAGGDTEKCTAAEQHEIIRLSALAGWMWRQTTCSPMPWKIQEWCDVVDRDTHRKDLGVELTPCEQKLMEQKRFHLNAPTDSSIFDYQTLSINNEDLPKQLNGPSGFTAWNNLVRYVAYYCPHRLSITYPYCPYKLPLTYDGASHPTMICEDWRLHLDAWQYKRLASDYAKCCEVLHDLLAERCVSSKHQATEATPSSLDIGELPALQDCHISVLKALHTLYPRLSPLRRIAEVTEEPHVSQKTTGKIVKQFMEYGWAERPDGTKRGTRLLAAGRQALRHYELPPK